MKNITKKILALVLALSTMVTLVVPAFSAGVNVDGQGGSSTVNGGGRETYNNADQLWKISIYYSRYDTNTERTKNLGTTSHWVQYGKTFYMYNPTANRGTTGKIKMDYIKKSVFVAGKDAKGKTIDGNKVNFLKTSSSVSSADAALTLYNQNYFYANKNSPAIAMNGYTNDAVKDFFGTNSNLVTLAKQAYLAAGYDNWTDCFVYPDGPNKGKKVTFSIDGFNGNYVDKTANGGKSATTSYIWDTTQKHLVFNDWTKGIKTDYKGKQIYLHPKFSGDTSLFGTAWVIVYEPVLCVEPKTTLTINGTTYKYVCCTPTEFAILQHYGIINLGTLANTVFGHLSNSTVLYKDWFTYTVPSGKFSATSSTMTTTLLNNIYKQAGWGMTIFDPYNYVIKDYKAVVSAPKSVKAGETFNVTFTHSNLSVENKGNTGKHESPINVKYVWVAYIESGSKKYWFDLLDLRDKTLSTSTALKKTDGSLITTYADAAKIVETRRAATSSGLAPYNKNHHYYRGAKDSNGNYIYKISHTYSYAVSSEFSGCNLDIMAYTNVDSNGQYTSAKKELNSGAYYKSGETANWGNNRGRKVISVTNCPEVEPVISVQLNNKTSNEDLSLAGKRFAVWCIGATQYSTTKGVDGKYELLPCTNTSNSGWVGIITTDANGYGEINLADANVGSGQDIYATSNTTADRTATGLSHGYFGTDYASQGGYFMPGGYNKNGETYFIRNSYWKGNAVFFEHPKHSGVDTSKYTLTGNVVTNKSTGAVVTGFTPSYQIQATKADGYVENSRPLREMGAHDEYLPANTTLARLYGIMFAGGDNGGGYDGSGKYNLYAPSNPKMTFVIRPLDDSGDSTTKYNYDGKEFKVFGYVKEDGTTLTTPQDRITLGKTKVVYDSSLTGTTIQKPNTTNYFLNTEIANCPIKNGVLTLDGNKVVYEDLIVFNLTSSNTEENVTVDIVEEPGTVTVNYKKGSGCTISSFQNSQVYLKDSSGNTQKGTLNASGSVTFTNVPAGPFSVVPVVKGDTNKDGNLCACDGSITQLSTAIDVGCNIYSTGHYITPFQTDSACGCELYKVASLGETTYIHLAEQTGTVAPLQNTIVDFVVEKKEYKSVNPIVKVSLTNFTETDSVEGKKFGVYAVYFNTTDNKYGINLSGATSLGTITISSTTTDDDGNQVGTGTLNLSTQANVDFLTLIKNNRTTNANLWSQLNTTGKKFGAFFDNSSGSPIYDAQLANNLIVVIRPLTALAKNYQTYNVNGNESKVFVPSTYAGKTYSSNWRDYETDEDGAQYVTYNHLGYFSSSTTNESTCIYEDFGVLNFSEFAATSNNTDYVKEIAFNMYEPQTGITVNVNKTNSLHANDNPAVSVINKNNGTSVSTNKSINAGSQDVFDELNPNSYTVSVSGVSSPYSISPTTQNVNFDSQAAIDAGATLNYTVDVKGTINLNFKLDGSYWATADNVNGKTVTLYKDGEALQTKTISNMKVSFTGIAINDSSFTFSINGGISCHTFNLPTVSADEIKNTYSSATAKYTVTKECKISYSGCVGKYNIIVNYLDGATFANVGSRITFALNNANSKTSAKSTDTKSVAEYGNLALNGSVSSTTAYNVTAQCSDSNYSITLVSGDPTNTVADFRNLHSSGHTITLTYEVRLVKRELKFNLTSSITKPTLFNSSAYWSNPIGQTVTVSLYNSSDTSISTKTVTIADNGTTSCSFGTVGAGTYTIKVTTNCSDIDFFTNNAYTTVCAQYSVTQSMGSTTATTVNGYIKNYVHKIKVTYTTDQDTGLKGNYFTIKVTNPSDSTTSSVISNDVEYIVPYGVEENINTYTITQTTAPENYEISENVDTFKPTLNKNETHIASFSNKYIWDFSIVISADKDLAVVGDKINYTVVIKNKRPKSTSPSLQIYWDNTVKQNETVTVAANSTVTKTYSYTIPTTEVVGGHILTAYINQDLKYYEINTSDNISQCSISMGGNFTIEGLTPDAEYMRGYEAVASCYVSGDIPKDTLTKDNLDVDAKLNYISQNGSTKTVQLERYENLVVPSNIYVNNKNIAYFKLTIPTDAKVNSQAEVVFTVNPDKAIGEYDYADNTASIKNVIIDKIESNPETLGRELKIPTGYYGTTVTPEISSATGERSWSQWSEKSDGTLQIDTYTTNTSIDSVVKIDNRCISAIWENNNLNMRSGYAFTIRTHPMITVNKNGSAYSEDRMITTFQSARVYYPEFRYNQELGKYTELEVVNSSNSNTSQFSVYSPYFLNENTGKSKYADTQDVGMVSGSVSRYELPINDVTSFQELGRKHFIPIFWKDGEYNLQLYATQLWCPVGVVSAYDYAKTSKGGTIIVEGSVYDDYYTARG